MNVSTVRMVSGQGKVTGAWGKISNLLKYIGLRKTDQRQHMERYVLKVQSAMKVTERGAVHK